MKLLLQHGPEKFGLAYAAALRPAAPCAGNQSTYAGQPHQNGAQESPNGSKLPNRQAPQTSQPRSTETAFPNSVPASSRPGLEAYGPSRVSGANGGGCKKDDDDSFKNDYMPSSPQRFSNGYLNHVLQEKLPLLEVAKGKTEPTMAIKSEPTMAVKSEPSSGLSDGDNRSFKKQKINCGSTEAFIIKKEPSSLELESASGVIAGTEGFSVANGADAKQEEAQDFKMEDSSERTHKHPDGGPDSSGLLSVDSPPIVIPNSSLKVSVSLSVNGTKRAHDSDFLQLFGDSLKISSIWPSLMYSVKNSPAGTNYESSFILTCDLFNPIMADMKHADLKYMTEIRLDYEYWTSEASVAANDLVDKLQYLTGSFFLNAEFKYPFVFSYYGRRLLQLNYATSLRTVTLFSTPLDHSSEPNKHDVLMLVLGKFQKAILYEFNTLNVMKECDLKGHRAAACRKHMARGGVSSNNTSIKSGAYDLRIFDPDQASVREPGDKGNNAVRF